MIYLNVEPTQQQIEIWMTEVENWLRYSLGEVITREGSDEVVRYRYIPQSSRLEKIVYIEHNNENYLDSIIVSYMFEVWELGDFLSGSLPCPFYPHGNIEIRINKDHNLVWDGQDALLSIC